MIPKKTAKKKPTLKKVKLITKAPKRRRTYTVKADPVYLKRKELNLKAEMMTFFCCQFTTFPNKGFEKTIQKDVSLARKYADAIFKNLEITTKS